MTAPTPLPTYVYKILDAPPAEPLPSELPVSNLDAKDGFVHLSTAAQVSQPALPWPSRLPQQRPGAFTVGANASRYPTRQASSSTPSPLSGFSRSPWTGWTTPGGRAPTGGAAPFRTSTGSWGPRM